MRSRRDEVSVRGLLRELRWIALILLAVPLVFWGVDVVRGGSSISFWMIMSSWVFFTVALGPMLWVRGLAHGTPAIWRATRMSLLWGFGCLALSGIAYGVTMWSFGPV
jgi:hypothetical protein